MLSTAFALLGMSVAVLAAWASVKAADHAADSARDLERECRKIAALREAQTALEQRLERLTGRVYAQARKPAAPPPDPDEPDEPDDGLHAFLGLQSASPVKP